MSSHRSVLATALAVVLSVPSLAAASVITAPMGTDIDFGASNYFGGGAITVAPGVTWSSTNASNQGGSVFGYDGSYGFGGNGSSDGVSLVGLNDSSDAYGVADFMTFSFDKPVASVGAVLNWVGSNAPVTIAAYSASGSLLDMLTLSSGGANLQTPDAFYGFQEKTNDIASFVLTDGYVAAIGAINVGSVSAVPEPATWAVMLAGFGGVGAALRQARRRTMSRAVA
jgi:hypothetical protein